MRMVKPWTTSRRAFADGLHSSYLQPQVSPSRKEVESAVMSQLLVTLGFEAFPGFFHQAK
jgi:hypothetical protein